MVERLRTIRDGLACGCSPAELIADIEAALAVAEEFAVRYTEAG